jgi:WD40 repeat protein
MELPEPRTDLAWAARYDGPGRSVDEVLDMGVSPDGSKVYVTGYSDGAAGDTDYATVGYDAATGARLWLQRYDGPDHGYDVANSIAVSPNGSEVFVTGYSPGVGSDNSDYATLAYDASTGALLWVQRYSQTDVSVDSAVSIAASPDGSRVFVTGISAVGIDLDYVTVAYDATSGAQLWIAQFGGPFHSSDSAESVKVSPDGSQVFVTGWIEIAHTDIVTLGYEASTGALQWATRYDGAGHRDDIATDMAVSPDGTKVFVTGFSIGFTGSLDYSTQAYYAATGALLWVRGFNGPGNGEDRSLDIAVDPSGFEVFATGASDGGLEGDDYATVAYATATGAALWVRRYNGPASSEDAAFSAAVSPDGSVVLVTGYSEAETTQWDVATVAYAAASARTIGVMRFDGPSHGTDSGRVVVVSPDGSKVFVAGATSTAHGLDYVTLAYSV